MSRELVSQQVRALVAYVPGEQPVGGVVKLNTNENPYPPSPRVSEALQAMDVARLSLYPDPVCRELRETIAQLHGCSVEQVFVGNGSDEVLSLCTKAFVDDDGVIGHFVPSYSLYPVLAAIRGVECQGVELGPDFEWTEPPTEGMDLFFLANPNAPTGLLYPESVVRKFCEAFEGVVVIDEAYVDFAARDCMHLAHELPNVLVARTLSKSYSLAGLRLGYAIGPAELVGAVYKIKDSYNVNALSQRLAAAAMSDPDTMRCNAQRICDTRARVGCSLEEMGFRVYPSEANFLWVKPGHSPAKAVFDALRRENILVRYFPGGRTGDCLRITVGTDAEMDALLEALRKE